jgi:hypothetical protein
MELLVVVRIVSTINLMELIMNVVFVCFGLPVYGRRGWQMIFARAHRRIRYG